jgi:UDP-N-acetylglucosamine--N-acetylmuramyl-(pentapeptide) pyrophosphoryl-undecaprenol N-acetylglucosamine transferase
LARRALLVAGGTGGHLFPALALREVLVRRGWAAHVATDTRTGELIAGVPPEEVHRIQSATLSRASVKATLGSLTILARGVLQSRALLKRYRPSVVVAFGGYPTVPPAVAARLLRVPIIAHEQNAVLGRANRLLLKLGAILATGFRNPKGGETAVRNVHVGNPVRKAIIEAVRLYRLPVGDEPFRLLVFGGSQGASVFSEVVPSALALISPDKRLRIEVVQQARAEDVKPTRHAYRGIGVQAEVAPFFNDMGERLADAHLVVCRAGASTVAEIAAIGRPAIFVPYPHALDQDQAANAEVLARVGGGWVLPQKELTATELAARIVELMDDPAALEDAAAAATSQGRVDAAEQLADLVESVAGGRAA